MDKLNDLHIQLKKTYKKCIQAKITHELISPERINKSQGLFSFSWSSKCFINSESVSPSATVITEN